MAAGTTLKNAGRALINGIRGSGDDLAGAVGSNSARGATANSVKPVPTRGTPGEIAAGETDQVGRHSGHQISVGDDALAHVNARHVSGSPLADDTKSVFARGESITNLARATDRSGGIVQANGNLMYVTNAGRNIGKEAINDGTVLVASVETQWYTTITDRFGNLVTMFPGFSGRSPFW
jgi:hypothetical protein